MNIKCTFQEIGDAGEGRSRIACKACGRTAVVLASHIGRVHATCRNQFAQSQDGTQLQTTPAPTFGPGTELKKLLKKLGITATPNCSCNARARTMDEKGSDWCEANVEEIVGWLREEATKRGLPFVDMAGRMIVKRAIKNARREVGEVEIAAKKFYVGE